MPVDLVFDLKWVKNPDGCLLCIFHLSATSDDLTWVMVPTYIGVGNCKINPSNLPNLRRHTLWQKRSE